MTDEAYEPRPITLEELETTTRGNTSIATFRLRETINALRVIAKESTDERLREYAIRIADRAEYG